MTHRPKDEISAKHDAIIFGSILILMLIFFLAIVVLVIGGTPS